MRPGWMLLHLTFSLENKKKRGLHSSQLFLVVNHASLNESVYVIWEIGGSTEKKSVEMIIKAGRGIVVF